MHPELIETLRLAQRFGFFGDRPIDEAVEHSQAFVDAIGLPTPGCRMIDLGSGGGLPGLVLADAFPQVNLVLADRREKRTDFLSRAAARLGYGHVEVRAGDVQRIVRSVQTGIETPFDVVTARGFGPPEITLKMAAGVLASSGIIVISEPPESDRWPIELLERLELRGVRVGAVRVFQRTTAASVWPGFT